MTKSEVIHRLCGLMDRVWRHIDPDSLRACDCVCRDGGHGVYRNSGEALDWMTRAIETAIEDVSFYREVKRHTDCRCDCVNSKDCMMAITELVDGKNF